MLYVFGYSFIWTLLPHSDKQFSLVAEMAAQRPMSSFLQASKRLKINGESKVVIATGTNPRFKKPIANHDNSLVHKGSSSKSFQEIRIGSKRISSKQSQATTVKSNPALPTEQSCVRHESAGERAGDWSQEETLQIEIAKVAMHATNNRSICEERVDEAQGMKLLRWVTKQKKSHYYMIHFLCILFWDLCPCAIIYKIKQVSSVPRGFILHKLRVICICIDNDANLCIICFWLVFCSAR